MSVLPTPSFDIAPGGRVAIIGAGCGGLETALALRAQGWTGPITVHDADPAWPYHKPPLSKAMLKGALPESEIQYRAPAVLDRDGITLDLGARVTAIDRAGRRLHFADGRTPPGYDLLVLALGGRARDLPDQPAVGRCENVHSLRSRADAERLRDALQPGRRMVILGGGFIGLEVAAAARAKGLEVLVLEGGDRVLARAVAPEISDHLQNRHRAEGVEIRTGLRPGAILTDPTGTRVEAIQIAGATEPCDLLVIAIGQVPNTELAAAAGLDVADGILVGADFRTSDPRIFAIGDCARVPSGRYGAPMRLESVPNALAHARALAAHLCGRPAPAEEVPWFWTDQYDIAMKMAGLPAPGDSVLIRGTPESGAFSVLYHRAGVVSAIHAVNRPADFMAARRLIEKAAAVAPSLLADDTAALMKAVPRDTPAPDRDPTRGPRPEKSAPQTINNGERV